MTWHRLRRRLGLIAGCAEWVAVAEAERGGGAAGCGVVREAGEPGVGEGRGHVRVPADQPGAQRCVVAERVFLAQDPVEPVGVVRRAGFEQAGAGARAGAAHRPVRSAAEVRCGYAFRRVGLHPYPRGVRAPVCGAVPHQGITGAGVAQSACGRTGECGATRLAVSPVRAVSVGRCAGAGRPGAREQFRERGGGPRELHAGEDRQSAPPRWVDGEDRAVLADRSPDDVRRSRGDSDPGRRHPYRCRRVFGAHRRTGCEAGFPAGQVQERPALDHGFHRAAHPGTVGRLLQADTYSSPQTAAVGLTESQARDAGHDVTVGSMPLTAVAKGMVHGRGGMVKVVAERDGRVLGVHLVGPQVSEMIAGSQLIVGWDAEPADGARHVHAHPTLSEAVGEVFLTLGGRGLHQRI